MTGRRWIDLGIAIALVLSLTGTSAAAAHPNEQTKSPGTLISTGAAVGVSAQTREPGAEPVVRINDRGRFHWGDAGIGAAAVFALAMIALGGGLVGSVHRKRRRGASGASPAGVS